MSNSQQAAESKAKMALLTLEQAWSYYSPAPQTPPKAQNAEDAESYFEYVKAA